MAAAMTVSNKSSLINSSQHSSPVINPIESFSPTSSSTTLSPESSNSMSSPDKSFVLNEHHHQQQSIRLVDYFVVCGLDKYLDVEPLSELPENVSVGEQVLNPFQCSYRCRVLCHYPHEVPNNPFDEDAISRN
ncbi:unnamed protein product [Rotaria sp. Silwood1]|nr:unnamed protein product [Rotaria sp. Silwood1]